MNNNNEKKDNGKESKGNKAVAVFGYVLAVVVSVLLGGAMGFWLGIITALFFGKTAGIIAFITPMLLVLITILGNFQQGKLIGEELSKGEEE